MAGHALLSAPLPLLVVQTILIVVVARVVGLIARRLGQPMVVAEIVAGIVLGPSLLGWAAPRFSHAVFPATSMGLLGTTSQLGLLLFMFLIGLELDPKLLRGKAGSSVAISYASILLPFGLGLLLALRVRDDLKPSGVSMTSFSLFMGVAMSITAFPVLARILVERRLLRSKVGAIAIACAAVDDVTAWCILAFVVSVARASSASAAIVTVLTAFGYIAAMFLGVRPVLARIADRTRLGLTQNLVAIIFVGVLVSSLLTELIGIHALFGAFLFGAVFPKQGTLAAALAEKVEDVVVVLLLPLFFAYSGLRTQLGLLDTPSAWLTCAGIVFLACLGKFGGSFVAGRLTGLSTREAGAVGILMNTRGLMELVVLNIGLDLGVISPALFTMMVVMALVTTFVTTPLLQVVYPIEQLARQLADVTLSTPVLAPVTPFTAVVCVSREATGPGLLTFGAAVAGRAADRSRLYALRLLRPTERASFVLEQQQGESGEVAASSVEKKPDVVLDPLADRARALDVKVRPLSFVSATPGKDICDVASVKHADLIVLGWNKPLLGGAMLTGVVHDVMLTATCDVGVLVDRGLEKIDRVLVPFLGSDHDAAALELARRISEHTGAKITLLHLGTPESPPTDAAAESARKRLGKDVDVEFQKVTHAVPSEAAIAESAKGYDLLLVGVGRQWGLEHKSFGRRAEAILERAATSVVVVRRGAPKSTAEALAETESGSLATVA